jgi:4-hydroxy-2-oxoheptanedioate aldolase
MKDFAFWMTTPHVAHVEIAHSVGFRAVVLDIEHGTFDLDTLDRFIPFCRALGIAVYAKVLGPQVEAIQQALDFSADGVIIPHIRDVAHARSVCAAAKYPPLGLRSSSGGRNSGYRGTNDSYFSEQNARVKCWPMIETAEALADAAAIAKLPTVDGLFAGPTDLSLTRGRARYSFSAEDQTDLLGIVAAAKAAGKPWVMPAWTAPERAFSRQHAASLIVVGPQYGIIRAGFESLVRSMDAER